MAVGNAEVIGDQGSILGSQRKFLATRETTRDNPKKEDRIAADQATIESTRREISANQSEDPGSVSRTRVRRDRTARPFQARPDSTGPTVAP
jgi:hypothetical protein